MNMWAGEGDGDFDSRILTGAGTTRGSPLQSGQAEAFEGQLPLDKAADDYLAGGPEAALCSTIPFR